tara:strand:- start:32 stop:748 length:717 start_codon:yes stop_codon:yes gene_type:complete
MSYINYIRDSISIYKDIYETLSTVSTIPHVTEHLINKVKEEVTHLAFTFKEIQDTYCTQSQETRTITNKIEPSTWNNYIQIKNNSFQFSSIQLKFFIDQPHLNKCTVVVEEYGIRNYTSFTQNIHKNQENIIKISSNIIITFTDNLINLIRSGELASSVHITFSYTNIYYPFLKLPFHIDRIFCHDQFWVMSILNNMDNEISQIKNKVLQKKYSQIKNNINKSHNSNDITDTFYNNRN